MNKLTVTVVLLAVVVCACHGASDRRNSRSSGSSAVEPSTAVSDDVSPQDLVAARSSDVFTARGKKEKGGGGGHKNKMEAMHMGLSYIKMVVSTLMAFIGHVIAFKSVGLALISVLIQVAQFVMTLKKSHEHAPAYKVVETPGWHAAPSESYGGGGGAGVGVGSYGSYGGINAKIGGAGPSPYGNAQTVQVRRRR